MVRAWGGLQRKEEHIGYKKIQSPNAFYSSNTSAWKVSVIVLCNYPVHFIGCFNRVVVVALFSLR